MQRALSGCALLVVFLDEQVVLHIRVERGHAARRSKRPWRCAVDAATASR
jgi:hypothetical protein